jgi:hypothetical protein
MEFIKHPDTEKFKEQFASRAKDVMTLSQFFLDQSAMRFQEAKRQLERIEPDSKWFDLRMLGIVLILISFVLKILPTRSGIPILESSEFIVVLIIGTVFLILGTYFNVKNMQQQRNLIEKETEAINNTIKACTGLMHSKMD